MMQSRVRRRIVLELGIDSSTKSVELRLGAIEEGSPDDVLQE